MITHPLLPKLRQLRLSGMLLTLDARAAQATERQLTPLEFLALLLDDELERRGQTRLAVHLAQSGCDSQPKVPAGEDAGPLRLLGRPGDQPHPDPRAGHLRLHPSPREHPDLRSDGGGQEPPGQRHRLRSPQAQLPRALSSNASFPDRPACGAGQRRSRANACQGASRRSSRPGRLWPATHLAARCPGPLPGPD